MPDRSRRPASLRLTSTDLTALVYGGEGQRAPLKKLCLDQLSKHKWTLEAVARFGGIAVPGVAKVLRRHYDLLAAVEKTAPEAATTVIRHPHVGAWAVQCWRRIWADPGLASSDLDYLGAIAASAAIRAGHECSLTLRIQDGVLMLPTLGRALLPGTYAAVDVSGPGKASIEADGSTIPIPPNPHTDAPGWQGLRMLTMGDRQLYLDDLDPNRSYEPYLLTERLGAQEVAYWQEMLDEAWRLLTEDHPGYALGLYEGLVSLIPVVGQGIDDRNVSATSGDAFGAVAASRPSDGAALAVTLMHEFQHTKLFAIGDIKRLSQDGAGPVFYAPWKPNPRPADALLHGIFAHMAVADFWRVHRHTVSDGEQLIANVEFARWQRQTFHAAELLNGRDVLTVTGRKLMSHVMVRLTSWREETVPEPALKIAKAATQDHLISWRLRNLQPDIGDVERLARDWLTGRPPSGVVWTKVREDPLEFGCNPRPDLLYRRLRDPTRFHVDYADSADPDVAYARGDTAVAADGYLARLGRDPALSHAWTGLGVTTDTGTALAQHPEVVYAVHSRITALSQPPDPLRLGIWLQDVSVRDLDIQVQARLDSLTT